LIIHISSSSPAARPDAVFTPPGDRLRNTLTLNALQKVMF
jgi:hypothetical protein